MTGVQTCALPISIFEQIGGLPLPKRSPQRRAYRMMELKRWREVRGIPLTLEPKYFPYAADGASFMIIAADGQHGAQVAMRLAYGIMQACWADERNCADTETLDQIAAGFGVDGAALRAGEGEAKATYGAYTQEAIERQVFGAPSYVLDGEVFWGQDRIELLADALNSSRAPYRSQV